MTGHPSFVRELAGQLGPPMFAATLVACLLERAFDPLHIVLLIAGLSLMWAGHWGEYHRGR